MNLWRDIPAGDNPPSVVNVVVEVISGSRDKYEYKIDWETFVLDRVLYSPVVFPVEYGFVPQTWFDDNDPLDIMVLSYEPLEVGCIVKARTIGALVMEDEKGEDPKILSAPTSDPRFCLRPEDEISVDSLLADLARSVSYPLDHDQIGHSLQHLRRAGLISFDWRQRTIKRERPMKDYVTKQVMTSEFWPKISEDWLKIGDIVQSKYKKVNPEYWTLLLQKNSNGLVQQR